MNSVTITKSNYSQELSELLRKISNGNVVLFLGSGFSSNARGVSDEEMPLAAPLANIIAELGGFNGEGDLRYAADRYLSNNNPAPLIDLFLKKFTVKFVDQCHKEIASAPWRRTYTTNYDLCFERAAVESGKTVTTVDISDPPSSFAGLKDLCVHINGSLNKLTPDTLNTSFKLSTASYLSPDSFISSSWGFPFQRDFEFCSAIVFVGYSLYDMEVQKVLHENEHYAKKTYFITRPSTNERSRYTLSKYGNVLPIGTKEFGKAIASFSKNFNETSKELILASLWRYEISESKIDVRDLDVDSFLMRGDIDDRVIDSSHSQTTGSPILIARSELSYAINMLNTGANIVVTADFGNGKSVFIRQLRSMLARESFPVYTADFKDAHQHDDLENLIINGQKAFLVIDSYEQNIELVNHFAEQKPPNIQLILGARTSIHERCRPNLTAQGLSLNEIAIDELKNEDVDQFIEIVTNAGYWEEKAALTPDAKRNLIARIHKKQLSLNLLNFLESPQMISRVTHLLDGLLRNSKRRDTIFAIALLSTNDMPLTSSLIADVAMNDEIFSTSLRGDEKFKQLFHVSGSIITTKSSLFARALISHQFSSSYIVEQLLTIVEMLGDTRNEVQERKNLQKKLLQFSVVERLLPKKQRKQNLVRYYELLKLKLTWLKTDPHFWLQYGMSQITYKEYDKAQSFLKQAYAFAARRTGYHTIQIDTQQARLHMLIALESLDHVVALNYFKDANNLIRKLPRDTHTYRQVELYRDVFEHMYPNFSGRNKAYFEHACRALLTDLDNLIRDGEISTTARANVTLRVKGVLEEILEKVAEGRKPEQ